MPKAPNNFLSIENGRMTTLLNPLHVLIPKISFPFFLPNLGPGHLLGPGVSLGRILGARQLTLWGGGAG